MKPIATDVVGSSPDFNLPGVCRRCDGDGELATGPFSATVVIDCPECKGAGGTHPENVAKSGALWAEYAEMLGQP